MTNKDSEIQSLNTEPVQEKINSKADHWLARINEGPLSPDEARAFNDWLAADPEHERQYRFGQMAMREVLLMRGESDLHELMRPTFYERMTNALYEAEQYLKAKVGGHKIGIGIGTGLAALSAALVLIFVTLQPPLEQEEVHVAETTRPAPATPQHETSIAEIRDVALPDGSVVTVGAASALDVVFTPNERRVVLSEGEAFFDVAKDPDRPFIVVADNTLIRVLGTKFDVNLGAEGVDVAVLEGRVEVIRPEGDSHVIRDDDIKHILTAGQKVVAMNEGPVRPVAPIEPENVAAWRRGELIWVDTPVHDIIADLNRYSTSTIILTQPDLGDLEYTLALPADDVSRGVRLLAASLGLDAKESATGEIELK